MLALEAKVRGHIRFRDLDRSQPMLSEELDEEFIEPGSLRVRFYHR